MNLHHEFVRLAFDINKMKNKLISLLLEIYETEIYKDHGCVTIYEYGFKYARLSKEIVEKYLRTLKNVADKPCLKRAIETQGIHKVALVATIATAETDKVFAQHVENMSKSALSELAKEIRNEGTEEYGLFERTQNLSPQKCQAVPEKLKIEMDEETQILFLKLKKLYAKDSSHKHALKVLMRKLEEAVNRQPVAKNSQPEAKTPINVLAQKHVPGDMFSSSTFTTRYISIQQKREILRKHNNHCAYPNCKNPHDVLHHREPFAQSRSHQSIIPLCKIHHEFAHNGLIAHQSKEPQNWQMNPQGKKTIIDAFILQKSRTNG